MCSSDLDARKHCELALPQGTRCEILCPVGDHKLDWVGHNAQSGVDYFAIYLSRRLADGELVAVTDVWGDYNSRLLDSVDMFMAEDGE